MITVRKESPPSNYPSALECRSVCQSLYNYYDGHNIMIIFMGQHSSVTFTPNYDFLAHNSLLFDHFTKSFLNPLTREKNYTFISSFIRQQFKSETHDGSSIDVAVLSEPNRFASVDQSAIHLRVILIQLIEYTLSMHRIKNDDKWCDDYVLMIEPVHFHITKVNVDNFPEIIWGQDNNISIAKPSTLPKVDESNIRIVIL